MRAKLGSALVMEFRGEPTPGMKAALGTPRAARRSASGHQGQSCCPGRTAAPGAQPTGGATGCADCREQGQEVNSFLASRGPLEFVAGIADAGAPGKTRSSSAAAAGGDCVHRTAKTAAASPSRQSRRTARSCRTRSIRQQRDRGATESARHLQKAHQFRRVPASRGSMLSAAALTAGRSCRRRFSQPDRHEQEPDAERGRACPQRHPERGGKRERPAGEQQLQAPDARRERAAAALPSMLVAIGSRIISP